MAIPRRFTRLFMTSKAEHRPSSRLVYARCAPFGHFRYRLRVRECRKDLERKNQGREATDRTLVFV